MDNFKITIENIINWIKEIYVKIAEIIFNTKIGKTMLIIIVIAVIGTIIYRIVINKKKRMDKQRPIKNK